MMSGMTSAFGAGRGPSARVDPRSVALMACLGLATAVAGLVLPWIGPLRPGVGADTIVVQIVAGLVTLLAALVAWVRQPSNPIWRLIAASYFASFIWELMFIPLTIFATLAWLFSNVGAAISAHLILAFPNGQLRTHGERNVVAFIYLYAVGTQLAHLLVWDPHYTCEAYCPRNLLLAWPDGELADFIGTTSGVAVPLIGIAVAVFVRRHWVSASPPTRRVLRPVALAFLFEFVTTAIGYPADALGVDAISNLVRSPVWALGSLILPVGLLIGVLRLRMTRSALTGAVLDLGALPTLTRLQQVLQVKLGDPALEVWRWSTVQSAWLDQDGRTVEPPAPETGRALLVIDQDGARLAAVDHDASLLDDAGLAATVAAAARVALEATDLRDELRAHGGSAGDLPTGRVTFVFGDLEGSTPLLESLGERYGGVLAEVRRIASDVADARGGRLVDALGDEVFLVFADGRAALAAAVALTQRMAATQWPDERSIRLRIGVHAGHPELTRAGYVGLDVHRAARVMAAGHGGQIVATVDAAAAAGPDSGITLRPLGRYTLRGLSEPISLLQVESPGLPTNFPPLRADVAG
jgi:class 3 adenylate cyclase